MTVKELFEKLASIPSEFHGCAVTVVLYDGTWTSVESVELDDCNNTVALFTTGTSEK